jgi:hypothetical protein
MITRLLKAIVGGLAAALVTALIIRFVDDAPMRVVSKLVEAEEDLSDQEAEALLRELASMT